MLTPFSYTIPANAIIDKDNDAMTFTVTLSSGAALASTGWLSYDSATKTFTSIAGTPTAAQRDSYNIKINVNDNHLGPPGIIDVFFTIQVVNTVPTGSALTDQNVPVKTNLLY